MYDIDNGLDIVYNRYLPGRDDLEQFVFEIYDFDTSDIAPRCFTIAKILLDNGLDPEKDILNELLAAFAICVEEDENAVALGNRVIFETGRLPAYYRACTGPKIHRNEEGIWIADESALWTDTEPISPKSSKVMNVGDFIHFLSDSDVDTNWFGIQRLD